MTRLTYGVAAIALLLAQHALVAAIYRQSDARLLADASFWLLPLRRLAYLPDLTAAEAALGFTFGLVVAAALAALSFRRASESGGGFVLAALSVVPGVQYLAVAALILLPNSLLKAVEEARPDHRANVAHIIQGLLAGMAIIVVAVLISAVAFGAYGWGLFVMTPFLAGLATAYIANRETLLHSSRSHGLVVASSALGAFALLMLALEGFICIILIGPLALGVGLVGGAIGRGLAKVGHWRGRPLISVALLPAIFLLDVATPPAAIISGREEVVIAASPADVWAALVSTEPIGEAPGLVAHAGLAYPIAGRISGQHGGERIGYFSTGIARERVSRWEPGKELAFEVLSQPAAMEEMSPYRRVYAPHVHGYFETSETRFTLQPAARGGTRLTVEADSLLRMEPVLYWRPLARWAVRENLRRVLSDVRLKAERRAGDQPGPYNPLPWERVLSEARRVR